MAGSCWFLNMSKSGVDYIWPNGIILHQARFPWNSRDFPLLNQHWGGNGSCEVPIIWADYNEYGSKMFVPDYQLKLGIVFWIHHQQNRKHTVCSIPPWVYALKWSLLEPKPEKGSLRRIRRNKSLGPTSTWGGQSIFIRGPSFRAWEYHQWCHVGVMFIWLFPK